jgi:hypothetical protein
MESNPVKAQPPGTTLRPLTFLIWQLFLCFMIVTNAITIGIEADHAPPGSRFWFVLGTVYLVVFTVELVPPLPPQPLHSCGPPPLSSPNRMVGPQPLRIRVGLLGGLPPRIAHIATTHPVGM